MMRDRTGQQRVTNIELFFDLVFVFAVTQLSHLLLSGAGSRGHAYTALLAALLLTMVWLLWSYTTWVTNWLDPDLIAVRLLLLALGLISLFSSAALPTAAAPARTRGISRVMRMCRSYARRGGTAINSASESKEGKA